MTSLMPTIEAKKKFEQFQKDNVASYVISEDPRVLKFQYPALKQNSQKFH